MGQSSLTIRSNPGMLAQYYTNVFFLSICHNRATAQTLTCEHCVYARTVCLVGNFQRRSPGQRAPISWPCHSGRGDLLGVRYERDQRS